MKIENIKFNAYPLVSNVKDSKNAAFKNVSQIKTYNPIYYKDYNVTFGDRLFRTPANFYAQEFNRRHMPQSMKQYLYEDYEDRQNIAPAQMMKIVFGDIEKAKSLEEVKEMYGDDEPLFANLHSMSPKNYRSGTLAEINLMREEGKTLFKNGKDDLGLYILKKIYIEGKTLKEINKDFKQDISCHYNGVSDITYQTLGNFGIRYPHNSFWHSFYVTREDFPRNYKPRKAVESRASKLKREITIADINSGNIPKPQKPKFQPKDHEIKKITDALIEGQGDSAATSKELKRSFRSDDPKVRFIQKYFGQISSISLDRVHASDEMIDYFSTADKSDSSKARMKKYWNQSPEMKAYLSVVMSDTIKLFFLTYGADGNNPEFQDLLKYADSIKPERERQKQLHNEKQLEYEKMFEEIDRQNLEAEAQKAQVEEKLPAVPTKLTPDVVTDIAAQYNTKTYSLKGKDGTNYMFVANLDEVFEQALEEESRMFPDSYASKYIRHIYSNPKADEKYKLTLAVMKSGQYANIADPKVMSEEDFEDLDILLKTNAYADLHDETYSAKLAMYDLLKKYAPIPVRAEFYKLLPHEFDKMSEGKSLNSVFNSTFSGHRKELNELYKCYMRNYSSSELQKTALCVIDSISKFNPDNSMVVDGDVEASLLMMKEGIASFKPYRKWEQSLFRELLQSFPYAKSLLFNVKDRADQKAKFETVVAPMIYSLIQQDPGIILACTTNDSYQRHKHELSVDIHQKFTDALRDLPLSDRKVFYADADKLKELEKYYKS